MLINGFNSDNYRYFRNKETGEITKYSREELERILFSENFNSQLRDFIYEYKIKPYPTQKEFDLLEYIRMQEPIVFKYDYYLETHFDKNDFLLITEWLNNKMSSTKMVDGFFGEMVKETNAKMFQKLYEGERIGDIKNFITMLEEKKELVNSNNNSIQEFFKFKGPISGFKIPFQKEETWFLTNPAVSFLLLNQKFIREMYASEEILGKEKEMIFYEEYKDNIPNTTIRYYDLKEDVLITNVHEVNSEVGVNGFNHHYYPLVLRMHGELLFCKENVCNYRTDLTVKTIAIKFFDSIYDRELEKEILKIANRVPYNEALINYQKDQEALKEKEKQEEIEELISKYPRKFHKSHLKPEEFLSKERAQAGLNLVRVLTNIAIKRNN